MVFKKCHRRARLKVFAAMGLFAVAVPGVTACTADQPTGQSITLVATTTSAEPRPALPDSVVQGLTAMAKQSKRRGDATVVGVVRPYT